MHVADLAEGARILYPVCTVTKIGAGSGLKIPPERLPFTPWVSRSMDFINFPPAKGELLTRANSGAVRFAPRSSHVKILKQSRTLCAPQLISLRF